MGQLTHHVLRFINGDDVMTSTTKNDLPQPTTDLNLAKTHLDEFGYCLLANALTPKQVEALRTRLVEQAAAEKQQGLAHEDGGKDKNSGINQRVWMLINKGEIFHEPLLHKDVHKLIGHVLGEQYLLSCYTANIAKPGGVAMNLHTDQWWMPPPTRRDRSPLPAGSITRERRDVDDAGPPSMIAPAVVVNVMWMLVDFTAENGGTRIVPRSHLTGRHPDKELDKDVEPIAAAGPAGTAMVFDGRMWHGTGANVSDGPRLGVLSTFCGPQFRTQENLTVGTSKEVLENAPPELLALLGFKVWNAYGRVESPAVDFIAPDETSLGELRPE